MNNKWLINLFGKYKNRINKRNQKSFEKILSNLSPENKKLIYLHHEWGGGTDLYLQNKINQLKNDNYIFVIIYKKKLNKISLEVTFQDQFTSVLLDNLSEISGLFSKIKIDTIYLNQVAFFPQIDAVFNFTKQIRNTSQSARLVMLTHDFSAICVNNHLVKNDGSKCDILENKNICSCNKNAKERAAKWQDFLIDAVDEIICFSQSSKQILSKCYPEISSKINVTPHCVDFLRKANVVKTNGYINIAVIGFLNKIKGCDLVEEMSQIILQEKLPVKIFVAGKAKIKGNKALKILGKYRRDDLPKILEKNQIDLIFISSICPETFSYTTNEAMIMGLKVACFNLGAQAEHIKKYHQGLLISEMTAKAALDEILDFISQTRK